VLHETRGENIFQKGAFLRPRGGKLEWMDGEEKKEKAQKAPRHLGSHVGGREKTETAEDLKLKIGTLARPERNSSVFLRPPFHWNRQSGPLAAKFRNGLAPERSQRKKPTVQVGFTPTEQLDMGRGRSRERPSTASRPKGGGPKRQASQGRKVKGGRGSRIRGHKNTIKREKRRDPKARGARHHERETRPPGVASTSPERSRWRTFVKQHRKPQTGRGGGRNGK